MAGLGPGQRLDPLAGTAWLLLNAERSHTMIGIESTAKQAMPKTAPLGFRVDPELKAALAKAAAHDDRTVAAWIVHVLRKRLAADGYLAKEAPPSSRPGV